MDNDNLKELIKEYIDCARYLLDELRNSYKEDENPIRAWKLGIISQHGKLGDKGDIKYHFHGMGCTFILEKDSIDIDFGDVLNTIGFDSNRLYRFYENRKDKYGEITSKKLKENLIALSNNGVIIKGRGVFRNLYFLKG